MVSSHAKVLVVREERLSAVLAFLSSLGFCARNLLRGPRPVRVVLVLGAGSSWPSSAPSTRASRSSAGGASSLALALFEAFVAARIALRLGLLAAQLELQRARAASRSMSVDPASFRRALGQFATGVTVVTTRDAAATRSASR